ncbi:MAG: MFS transporter [Alphaproteobacteria bacterium]|nr:MFS transporter [Alphaproteobacteria bacterium]
MSSTPPPLLLTTKILNATVIVTALGYLVDMYDFLIFNVTRTESLSALHLSGDALTNAGLFIGNGQLFGLLVGSYLWGVLGDKFGRKSCLFASILTYSLAALYCSAVQTVDHYALGRFLAGVGVAGELGVGLTLISEKLAPDRRGYGVAFFLVLGICGVLLAALATEELSWRKAYFVGGIAGLVLLLARVLVFESGMYAEMAKRVATRGGLKIIFWNPQLLRKYIAAIFLVAPCTFIPQIVWTLSPEIAQAQGITEPIKAGLTLTLGFAGGLFGALFACLISEKMGSRKKAIIASIVLGVIVFLKYLLWIPGSREEFYITNGLLGLSFGIWMIGGASIAEQVGTNVRATVATTVPNFARALVIPMNLLFGLIKPLYNSQVAVGVIGLIVFAAAFWGWMNIDETYGKDINYEET